MARAQAVDGQTVALVVEAPVGGRLRPHVWQWLAPSMAVFVLAFGLSSPTTNGFTRLISSPMDGQAGALALEDGDLSTYFASHSSHNGFSVATFDWTNRSQPVTTTDAVTESSSTNRLRR